MLRSGVEHKSARAVKPIKLNVEKVYTFAAFIDDFERYSLKPLRRDKNCLWVELKVFGSFFGGVWSILINYFSIYCPKVNYLTIITRLENWCKKEKDRKKKQIYNANFRGWKLSPNKG